MADYLAITIWQPWAMLIAEGCKRFEFRRWSAPRAMWGERIATKTATHMTPVKQKYRHDPPHRCRHYA